jgi:Spy/CpxP family protein refolding chaperone
MPRTLPVALSLLSLFASPFVVANGHAQQGPPPPPPGMQGPGGHGPMGGGRNDRGGRDPLGLPPGTWWKAPELISQLGLTADQQKHMDEILRKNRIQLIHLKASLEEEQLNLEPLVNAAAFDQAKTLAEVAKIADLRAQLEKTDASMLVELRGVLSADQWTRLHTLKPRPEGGRGGREDRGPKGAKNGTPAAPSPGDEDTQ